MEKPPSGKTKNITQGLLSKEEEYMLVTTNCATTFRAQKGNWASVLSLKKLARVATDQGKNKFFKGREKSENFILSQGKSQGKLKQFNTAVLIPLKAGRNIWGHHDLVENLLVLMAQWKEQL